MSGAANPMTALMIDADYLNCGRVREKHRSARALGKYQSHRPREPQSGGLCVHTADIVVDLY